MALIVAERSVRSEFGDEFPVLSISPQVDSGYIMQHVHHYVDVGEANPTIEHEHHGNPANPEDFKIGYCRFVKKDGKWFYEIIPGYMARIVYGEKTLEIYASGEMFRKLYATFGGPD